MRAIFISYRRDDAAGEAGRLFDDLTAKFGPDKVFMDVVGIEPGHDFRKVIDQNVASCGVLLAMIGKGWVDAKDDAGRRRLDDPLDFVRLETATALKRDILVIPVLVRGGRMPRAEQLPEELTDLAYRNGVELTHARWGSDVELLIKALRSHVGNAEKETSSVSQAASDSVNQAAVAVPETPRRSPFSRRALIGVAVAIVVAAAAVWYQYIEPRSLRPPSITTIIVPNAIHVGQTFAFDLAYDAPDAAIVQIQRRVLESSIKWPQEQTTVNVSNAAGKRSGSISYAFPASQAPYKATAEFVLIDAKGRRSEPRRTSFEVLPATATAQSADRIRNNRQVGSADANGNVFCANCATVIGVREVAPNAEATGTGAIVGGLLGGVLGDQVGHGRSNDAATAAGAVAGALAGHRSKSYEITVRYNDGHAEVIRESTGPRWHNGDRVRVVNGALHYAP